MHRVMGACSTYLHERADPEGGAMQLFDRPLAECPTCGAIALEAVVEADTDDVHFLCRNCSRCWRVELGYVQRMAPDACHGCPHYEQCEAVYNADHASSR
jgi:hypothetical protein